MKKNFRLLAVCLAASTLFGLTACDDANSASNSVVTENVEDARKEALAQVQAKLDSIDKNAYTEADLAVLATIEEYGLIFVNNSSTVAGIKDAANIVVEQIQKFIDGTKKLASGVYSFVASSYEERTEILAILEKYAVENFLTGFSLIDDGGYSLYRPEVQRGVTNYITGYGWGTLSDGDITADLANEANPDWKRYYHTFLSEDPKQINYGDDKGSVVGNLIGYIASSYWGTRINETKDGYEWYPELAKEMPQAVNASEKTGLATKYKWKLKTEADGLKYNTLTSKDGLKDYAGRGVKAEDYLTSYKMLFTKANNWARGAETLDGAGAIKGVAQYYSQSGDGYNAAAWENVGLKVVQEGSEWVMEVEFIQPCSSFYAMYYMASSIHSPVPESFITEALGNGDFLAGSALYQKTNLEKGLTPVDTSLSCAPYVLEAWNADEEIVFKKNELFDSEGRYKIKGIHYDILTAAQTDLEAGLKEFLAGNLHACSVPATRLDDFKNLNDERGYAVRNPGESNFKLNVNTCTQERWEELFGVNGTITQTQYADYWQCEPAMSNKNFLLGLSYSIDRTTYADNLGKGYSVNYFGDGYLSDPENGVAYNNTEAHKDVTSLLTNGGANPDGYNLEMAKAYFVKAFDEMVEAGTYAPGDVCEIEVCWMYPSDENTYGAPIAQYFQTAFEPVTKKYGITLEVVTTSVAVWSDVYYNKMMVGQYDIAFGSISGNPLNPLNFLEVLKSDNSSGFTLNWGADTSEINLEYDGQLWSFDSLWQAAETGGYFSQGKYVAAHDAEFVAEDGIVVNEDGTVTLTLDSHMLQGIDGVVVTPTKAVLNGYLGEGEGTYTEEECEFVVSEDGIITVTVSAEDYRTFWFDNAYNALGYPGYAMIDIYYDCSIAEVPSSSYDSIEFFLPEIAE